MVELVDYDDGRAIIATLGGLASQSDLGRRWGVSRERIGQMVRENEDFPEPVATAGDSKVWFAEEADDWRLRKYGHLKARW